MFKEFEENGPNVEYFILVGAVALATILMTIYLHRDIMRMCDEMDALEHEEPNQEPRSQMMDNDKPKATFLQMSPAERSKQYKAIVEAKAKEKLGLYGKKDESDDDRSVMGLSKDK